MSKKSNKKNISNIEKNDKYSMLREVFPIIPFIILVFFLPFIIRLKLIPLEGPFYEYWNGETINADFFTYYKKIFIYLMTIWTLLHAFFFTKKIKKTKAYYFLGGFGLLVILSTIFSKYPQIALHGFNERHEGMWVVLCYLLLIFSAINLVNTDKQIKYIIYSLGFSGMIISIISIFQFFGMDIFETELAKNFMISKEIMSQIQEFNIQFGEGYSYGVFYNPNYLGGYMSFYSPLMLGYAIFSKDIKEKILFGIFFILSIFALVFSRSEAGVLGTISAILFMLTFIYIKYLLQNREKEEYTKVLLTRLVPIFLAIVLIPLSISYVPMERNPLERIRKEAIELLTPNREKIDYREIGPINDIYINENNEAVVKISGQEITLSIDGENLKIIDYNGNEIYNENIDENFEMRQIGKESYESLLLSKYKFNFEKLSGIELYFTDKDYMKIYFLISNNEIVITDSIFKQIKFEEAPYMFFSGKGSIASGRGYIWSRSLPIVFKNIVWGKGQDTFITIFPQNDIYAKQIEVGTNYGLMWSLTDKPHSLYIQIGIQSGFIALTVVLIGFLALHIKGLKKYLSSKEWESLVITSSIFGWLISSIFNDSIIGITPIVVIFIGILCFLTIDTKIKDKAVKNNE